MNTFHSELEKTRKDAQSLHKRISDNIAKAEATTMNDVKAVKADTRALAARIKALVADQADAFETNITSTIDNLEVAGKDIEMKAIDSFRLINDALLDSARTAIQSLSHAVAEIRTKVADKIAPKTNKKEVKS